MTAYKISIEYFWQFQSKTALGKCCSRSLLRKKLVLQGELHYVAALFRLPVLLVQDTHVTVFNNQLHKTAKVKKL